MGKEVEIKMYVFQFVVCLIIHIGNETSMRNDVIGTSREVIYLQV